MAPVFLPHLEMFFSDWESSYKLLLEFHLYYNSLCVVSLDFLLFSVIEFPLLFYYFVSGQPDLHPQLGFFYLFRFNVRVSLRRMSMKIHLYYIMSPNVKKTHIFQFNEDIQCWNEIWNQENIFHKKGKYLLNFIGGKNSAKCFSFSISVHNITEIPSSIYLVWNFLFIFANIE